MILLNRVIDIIESDYIPKFPPDQEGNTVIAIECDSTVQIGDEFKNGIIIGTNIVEPTQLSRIEEAVSKSITELRQEGYDNCVMDMVKEGVI